MTLTLSPHPATPCRALRQIVVTAARHGAVLMLDYDLSGDIDALILPKPVTPQRRDGLWRHTCCEAFVGVAAAQYCELNFAPSGEWAAYRFDDYRIGMRELIAAPPRIVTTQSAHGLRISATAPLAETPLFVGFACVIEERDGTLSYWALAHSGDKPDFHDRATWRVAP
jgi:hypothetical protein